MMPHDDGACPFEVANCNLKVLGRPPLFEVANCDLRFGSPGRPLARGAGAYTLLFVTSPQDLIGASPKRKGVMPKLSAVF